MSTGARRLFETLQSRGVEVCFANPGTTELDLVRALEQLPALRCVLGLQENVCTGAADGYGRMTVYNASHMLWEQRQTDNEYPATTGTVIDAMLIVRTH